MKKAVLVSSYLLALASMLLVSACGGNVQNGTSNASEWIDLFNGEDLNKWTPKFKGYSVGHNFKDTFRVEDGLLTVNYSNYDRFNGEYGHLFYSDVFSHYRLQITYRFIGEQLDGGPDWAYRNNGLMIHAQPPETMKKDQEFPVSIEVQLLGGNGEDERHTANVCTPYSHIVMSGKIVRKHCIDSTSKTFHGDQWVTVEIEVKGSDIVKHRINDELVYVYNKPQLDQENKVDYSDFYGGTRLKHGHIAIQAETHPTQFKSIKLLPL